ncbi:MAG TPA: MMPL family transporter [Thermoplasmata archaeon]|nr:MMPL family transporter [Thermoplasmata archaeon]
MAEGGARSLTGGERAFSSLGRGIVRHPWYAVGFWVVLLVVALPFLSQVGNVTTNSATTLPASAPSAQASAEIARLFPNLTAGSASYLLFTGSNITGPVAQAVVVNVTAAVESDPSITYLSSVDSLYTAYESYLFGQAELALGTIGQGLRTNPSLPGAVNGTAAVLWGPPSAFLANWFAQVNAHPATPPSSWNYPAYNFTRTQLASSTVALGVLAAFYGGPPSSPGTGFNGSLGCGQNTTTATSCADSAARVAISPLLSQLFNGTGLPVAAAVLADLGVENSTSAAAQELVSSRILSAESGLTTGWIRTVWSAFPNATPAPLALASWARGIAYSEPVSQYPLPIPDVIRSTFLAPSGDATLVIVSYTKDSGYTTSSGATPIYSDVTTLNALVPPVVARSDPSHSVSAVQTGPAALDQTENSSLASSIALVLPLTILTLVLITMFYFRAPLVPVITFGGLGIALALGLGGVVLLGTLVQHVDQTSLELENTFVLGVGTDYSIFLVARYREELHRGAEPREAVVTSVTWAGQSIATSGATAILATLALTFSGVALLSQWGMVLSLAVLIAVLVSLTMVPALLVLIGPRVFWPRTGDRLERAAEREREDHALERTYFYRVGRRVTRRPMLVVGLVLLASVPLVYVALTSTSSYDFYAQLPLGHPATDGLKLLTEKFGSGFVFPINALVTFSAPLLPAGVPNATEFRSLDALTSLAAGTSGVARVDSPVGPAGANLSTWLAYPSLPPAAQANLGGALSSYLGSDGRTVWLTIYPVAGGLSNAAVSLLQNLRSGFTGYASTHAEVASVAFGGGAAVTSDIESQTSLATERMAILVCVGLVLVLFIVLRSYLIPLLAVATIGLSLGWAWGITNLVFPDLLGLPLFYFVPTVLFILILGLGIDYNIFLLTRVREERLKGRDSIAATAQALGRTGGIITAAAVILASAFAILLTGDFVLLQAIGFAVATAIVLDAMIVRTYLVPAALVLLKDRVWSELRFGRRPRAPAP